MSNCDFLRQAGANSPDTQLPGMAERAHLQETQHSVASEFLKKTTVIEPWIKPHRAEVLKLLSSPCGSMMLGGDLVYSASVSLAVTGS